MASSVIFRKTDQRWITGPFKAVLIHTVWLTIATSFKTFSPSAVRFSLTQILRRTDTIKMWCILWFCFFLFHFKIKHCHMFLPWGRMPSDCIKYQVVFTVRLAFTEKTFWNNSICYEIPSFHAHILWNLYDRCIFPTPSCDETVISEGWTHAGNISASKAHSLHPASISARVVEIYKLCFPLSPSWNVVNRFEAMENPLPNNAHWALLAGNHPVCQHLHLCQP